MIGDYVIIALWQMDAEEHWELVDDCFDLNTALSEREDYNNRDKKRNYEVYKKVTPEDY